MTRGVEPAPGDRAPSIRDAAPGDASEVAGLWNNAIRDTVVTFNPVEKEVTEVAALMQPSGGGQAFLVAVEAGPEDGRGGRERVLGFARSFQFRGGAGYAHTLEHTILLDPAAQGRGVGRVLIEALCARAVAGGAHTLWAGVSSGNPAGRAFHAATGFDDVATLPEVGWKFGRWWDLHLMRRRLGGPGA